MAPVMVSPGRLDPVGLGEVRERGDLLACVAQHRCHGCE